MLRKAYIHQRCRLGFWYLRENHVFNNAHLLIINLMMSIIYSCNGAVCFFSRKALVVFKSLKLNSSAPPVVRCTYRIIQMGPKHNSKVGTSSVSLRAICLRGFWGVLRNDVIFLHVSYAHFKSDCIKEMVIVERISRQFCLFFKSLFQYHHQVSIRITFDYKITPLPQMCTCLRGDF